MMPSPEKYWLEEERNPTIVQVQELCREAKHFFDLTNIDRATALRIVKPNRGESTADPSVAFFISRTP